MFAKNQLAKLLQPVCPLQDHFCGGELEAHVPVRNGRAHKLFLDPATGIFRIKIGQARIPLVPLLKTMGVTDKQLRESWGDLAAVNQQKSDPQALKKLYERVRSTGTETDPENQAKSVAEAFQQMELDPDVTKRTLGQAFTHVSADSMLATTKKLLAVSRGEQEPDDRDAMPYQKLMGPEDLFAERITKAKNIARNLLWKSTARRGIDHIPAGVLTNALQNTLTMSGLGQALEEINTAEILDHQSRVTRRGEGGIQDASAIPMSSRAVNPSQLGLIDYLRTPESLSAGIDVRLARNAMKGSDGKLYTKLINARSGLTETRSANDIADSTMSFSGELQSGKPYVNVLQNGKIRTVPREDVDYELPDTESSFSPLGNMIPFKSSVKGQRSVMGSRFLTQALPLVNAEAPYVQSGIPGLTDRSFEQEYGSHMGALRSSQGGVVTKVAPDSIEVRNEDGTKETHELYNNFSLNRKSVTGDSQIWVKRRAEVWSTPIGDYDWQVGDETLSIDPDTRDSAWMPITGYTKHTNDKQLLRIVLDSGRAVVITEDHSLMVMGDDGDLVSAYPGEVVCGETRLPIAFPDVVGTARRSEVDLGHLVGIWLACGMTSIPQRNMLMLGEQVEEKQAQLLTLLQRLGGTPTVTGGSVRCTMPEIAAFLRDNFGRLAGEKHIPNWVYQTHPTFRSAIVSGFFAGNGCLWSDGKGAVQLVGASTSQMLRDGIVQVLSTLGVFATLMDMPRQHINDNWSDAFGFRVISCHIERLPQWFFYSGRQLDLESRLRDVYRNSVFDGIPVPNKAARRVLYGGLLTVPPVIYKEAHLGAVHKRRIVDVSGPFGDWARGDVLWDRVMSITPVETQEFVYDLSVAESECFAVNHGIVVHNTFINQTPIVRPGQTFKPGDLLARSNYTDNEGTTALGMNARVAYMPDDGYNYEDAISISESFAKRMRSTHAYQHQHEWEPGDHQGLKAFISVFPSQYTKKQLEKFDDSGVVKQGETLHFGDPMILIASERERNKKALVRSRTSFSDKSITWDHHTPGIVTDVVQTAKGPAVVVKTYAEMNVDTGGAKHSGVHVHDGRRLNSTKRFNN